MADTSLPVEHRSFARHTRAWYFRPGGGPEFIARDLSDWIGIGYRGYEFDVVWNKHSDGHPRLECASYAWSVIGDWIALVGFTGAEPISPEQFCLHLQERGFRDITEVDRPTPAATA